MTTGIDFGNVLGSYVVSVTFDVASVAANTSVQQSVTVPGVKVGDVPMVSNATHTAGLQYGPCAVVTAADTISVTLQNSTAGALDPASQTLTFVVFRPEGGVAKSAIAD